MFLIVVPLPVTTSEPASAVVLACGARRSEYEGAPSDLCWTCDAEDF